MNLILLMTLMGCGDDDTTFNGSCDLNLQGLAPEVATHGDSVVVTGTPFTTRNDTAVFVGSTLAKVTDVTRIGCVECDECREEMECTPCGECTGCVDECGDTCVESVAFDVPNTENGDVLVTIYNSHGSSFTDQLTIISDSSSDNQDTGRP